MTEENIIYRCTELTGTLTPVKVRYWIEGRSDGFYVACEFSAIGPMAHLDAMATLQTIRVYS